MLKTSLGLYDLVILAGTAAFIESIVFSWDSLVNLVQYVFPAVQHADAQRYQPFCPLYLRNDQALTSRGLHGGHLSVLRPRIAIIVYGGQHVGDL
jgi:hypothetical protein